MRQPCVILLDSESCSDATVAQLVAQRIRNAWVAGSSPASGLIKTPVFTGVSDCRQNGSGCDAPGTILNFI